MCCCFLVWPTIKLYFMVLRGSRYIALWMPLKMGRHWPPKLFVLITLPRHVPDTTSNLKRWEERVVQDRMDTQTGIYRQIHELVAHTRICLSPQSQEFDVRREDWAWTFQGVLRWVTAKFILSVLLTVLVSVTHQRPVYTLPWRSQNRKSIHVYGFDSPWALTHLF